MNIPSVLLSTSVHYLFLKHLNRGARLALKIAQIRLGYGVIVSLVAHSIEVALFAFAYKVSRKSGFGTLEGNFVGSVADHLYFSYAAFTTVGFGDIVPTAQLRLLAGHGSPHGLCADHLDGVVSVSGNDLTMENLRLRV